MKIRVETHAVGEPRDKVLPDYQYKIEPRPLELGGGWRLRLLEDGEEVGGGVFPLPEHIDINNTQEASKAAEWIYDEALAEASVWLASRP